MRQNRMITLFRKEDIIGDFYIFSLYLFDKTFDYY